MTTTSFGFEYSRKLQKEKPLSGNLLHFFAAYRIISSFGGVLMGKAKSIDGLMRYLRDEKKISIKGSTQKRQLRNIGYYHGYKGYRFIGKASNALAFSDFQEILAIHTFDTRLKSLLFPPLMSIETALKNYALEEILSRGHSGNFNYIYTNYLTDYTRYPTGSNKQKDAIKKRLLLRDHVYSALTREYDRKNAIVQHFYHKDSSVPIWGIFEVLTLGEFGNLFSCLDYDIRRAISKQFNLHEPSDTNALLLSKIIYVIKDLRNAVAHNNVVFDTRFSRARVDGSIGNVLEIRTGIKNITFSSITDYIILVVYLLKCLHVSKTDIRKLINEFYQSTEALRKELPPEIFSKIVFTDTRSKLVALNKYV